MPELLKTNLPQTQRFITTHNDSGYAIFVPTSTISESMPWEGMGLNKNQALAYTTNVFPANLDEDADVRLYQQKLLEKPGLTIHGGTILRYVDYAPGTYSPMHRTISVDYGVVVEGEIELELDSGEKRIMKRGDVSIMRATMHAWRNASETDWARVLFVLMHSEAPTVAGLTLGEDYGKNFPGMKPSA